MSLNCIVHIDIKTSEWEVLSLIPAAGVTFSGLRAGDQQQRHLSTRTTCRTAGPEFSVISLAAVS